jgi:uncharacterized membrane protein YfcA
VRTLDAVALIAAGAGAGAMNALAGGGTILTFPVLLFLGLPAKVANATSTVALVPGAAASFAGYWQEVRGHRRWLRTLFVPSLVGGAVGSLLLLATPERLFARLAPLLVLFATLLFIYQNHRGRARRPPPEPLAPATPVAPRLGRSRLLAVVAQLGVAIYGGYFGAGIGILMLVILGALGLENIHAMNGLKNFFGICINGVAAAIFIAGGSVAWAAAGTVLVGAVVGGYVGARIARFVGQARARQGVVIIGLLVTLLLLLQEI